ncbi:hypothetical protein CDD83_2791 [Cordyceps sp. RAO-2017]|nr:hypothetical protein CDD83_2791 [Cordyceps sp. RAO-2017]
MKAFFSSRASDAQAPTAPSSSSAAAARSSSQRGLRGTKTTTKSSTTSKPSNTKSSTANTKPSKHEVGLVVKPVFPCSASASVSSDADADAHSAPSRRGRTRRDASAGPPAPAGPPRPSTPSSPVRIPKPGQAFAAKRQQVVAQRKRHPRQARPVEPISPSLAALLAVTDIPRPRRRQRGPDQPLTVDDIVADHHVSEKELSLTLTRRPLDLLLSPPDDLADGLSSACEGSVRCALARTTSADSIPSLGGDSFTSDTVSSLETPLGTVDLPSPRRRPSPVRRCSPPPPPAPRGP